MSTAKEIRELESARRQSARAIPVYTGFFVIAAVVLWLLQRFFIIPIGVIVIVVGLTTLTVAGDIINYYVSGRRLRRLQTMNEPRIAAALLTFLASGGTVERAMAELPAFKAQIQSAFDWMKSNAQCTAGEIGNRADRLREVIRRKENAIENQNWALAADIRAEQCALVESLGLRAPGEGMRAILDVGIEEQMQNLSALLHDLQG
jgi:hypothetical protein